MSFFSGYCNNCKHSLPKVEVTNEDYIELKESLFKNAMLGKSVFAKSTPNEIENFLSFINENGPFDIVIDGLNVVYSKPKKIDTTILLNVIKHFKGQNKKILVIGRKHMEKWRVQDVKFIKQNSATFYTDDLSVNFSAIY